VSDPELKEIYSRFCEGEKKDIFLGDATLTYTLVQSELRDAADRKNAQLLAFAKERATEKMLHECCRLQCKLPGGHEAQEKTQLLEFLSRQVGTQDDELTWLKILPSFCPLSFFFSFSTGMSRSPR
jgi:hypothetical protein